MNNRRYFLKNLAGTLYVYKSICQYHSMYMSDELKYKFTIGNLKCTLYYDFDFGYRIEDYFLGVELEKVLTELQPFGIIKDPIPSPYVSLLVETETENILIDTGLGNRRQPLEFKGRKFEFDGRLIPILDKEKRIENIDKVILTHLHPDHAGGVIREDGTCNFPNVEFFIHLDEWNYWNDSYAEGSSPVFDYTLNKQIRPLKDYNLNLLIKNEIEIVPGLRLIKIPGHTPGQLAVHLSSSGQDLLYISDAWLHPLHIRHLDWKTVFDIDHDQARQSRITLLEMAYKNSSLVQSFHFDFPGLGYIDKTNTGWEWIKKEIK